MGPSDPDEELLTRVAQGDPAAVRALVARKLPRLLSLAGRMLGDPREAEDVAQDAFLRLWRQAPRWEPRARIRTWLHRVAYNLCIDRLRRRGSVPLEDIAEPADPAPGPAQSLHRAEVGRAVQAALDRLPERQRAAIALVHYEDLSNIEAAAAMSVSVEAIESLLSRGRRSLRAQLGGLSRDLAGEA